VKNYLLHFRITCGLFQDYFFKSLNAIDERKAIIEMVSYFRDEDELTAKNYIADFIVEQKSLELELEDDYENAIPIKKEDWTIEDFWKYESDMEFQYSDFYAAFELISFKEVAFDINRL
jgi:hypothetical protein